MNLPITLLTAAFAFCSSALVAQAPTVLDDFAGSSIDENRWFVHPGPVPVANSRANFSVTAKNKTIVEKGLHSTAGFVGDFEFVLDFDKLTAANRGWGGGLWFGVYSAEDLVAGDAVFAVEVAGGINGTGSKWRSFAAWLEDSSGSKQQYLNAVATLSAGQLRITRTGKTLTAAVRPQGQATWSVFKSWASPLSDLVAIEIFAWVGNDSTNNTGTFEVSCDKVTYVGKRLDGPINYGSACHGMLAFRNSFPYLGSTRFGIVVDGGSALANAPLVLIMGFQRTAIPLSIAGAPGCYLNTDHVLQLGIPATNKDGFGLAPLPVPNDSQLLGLKFNAQMAALKAGINNLGYAFSNGVAVEIIKR